MKNKKNINKILLSFIFFSSVFLAFPKSISAASCVGVIKCLYLTGGICDPLAGYYTKDGCGFSNGSCQAVEDCPCSIGNTCHIVGPGPSPTASPGQTPVPTAAPPGPCYYVSDNGCYTGNCPDDLIGHGRGSCAVGQYWCTGGHMEGDCYTPPSCSVSLSPSSGSISTEESTMYTANVSVGNGSVGYVWFTSNNESVATVNAFSDSSPPYSVLVYGAGEGGTTITSGVVMDSATRCSTTSTITVLPNGPWWQVKDGDVITNGDLRSSVLSGQYFNLVGGGGYPGVPMYGGSTNLTNSNVSTKGWFTNSSYSSAKLYNSVYFINSVPSEVTVNEVSSSSVDGSFFESGGTQSFGYYWYIYDATSTGLDLTISSASNLGSRKVILIVKGANLNLGGNINLTDGEGFFLGVTSGNMVVSPVATSLEGIYVSDGAFSTGTSGIGTDSQLLVRGTVAGFGGISLQRDLAINTTSAELFEYAPDQDLLFPAKLGARPSNWREVAP